MLYYSITNKFPYLYNFFQILRFFKTRGILKKCLLKISHYFVELDELILKMYTVLGFEIVFDKLIEENWKKICVEICSPTTGVYRFVNFGHRLWWYGCHFCGNILGLCLSHMFFLALSHTKNKKREKCFRHIEIMIFTTFFINCVFSTRNEKKKLFHVITHKN